MPSAPPAPRAGPERARKAKAEFPSLAMFARDLERHQAAAAAALDAARAAAAALKAKAAFIAKSDKKAPPKPKPKSGVRRRRPTSADLNRDFPPLSAD